MSRAWYYDVGASVVGAFGVGSIALNWLEWWAALLVGVTAGGLLGFQHRDHNAKH